MKRTIENWPLGNVYALKNDIDPSPPFQRSVVWTLSQQQLFIDSILRNIDVPKIYLAIATDERYEWKVVDGQQRLTAIWEFMDGKYQIADDAKDVNDRRTVHVIANNYFDDLPPALKVRQNGYTLSVVILEEEEEQEIEDMFLRLQNGTSLNSAEKRNAIPGNTKAFVRDLAESHELFTKLVFFRNSRYAHHEIVAQMMLIERMGGPTPYTHTQLTNMYKQDTDRNGRTFSRSSAEARKLERVLDFLLRAFSSDDKRALALTDDEGRTRLLTKLNVISLYTVASELLESYAFNDRYKDFCNWFIDFEGRRSKGPPEEDDEMYGYQQAIIQRTGAVAAQRTRREVLIKDLLASIPDLALLDDQRQFSQEQRYAIYQRASGKCVNPDNNPDCLRDCTWANWHADHIIPYSKGGPTIVENGQLLCPSCNWKKSDKMPTAS